MDKKSIIPQKKIFKLTDKQMEEATLVARGVAKFLETVCGDVDTSIVFAGLYILQESLKKKAGLDIIGEERRADA